MNPPILVADDHDQMREFYRTTMAEFSFDMAEGGQDLVRQALANPYRLILTDLTMPDLSGLEAAEIIRRSEGPNRNTCICAISGDPAAVRSKSFDQHFTKPIDLDLLRRLFYWASDPDLPRFILPVD